MISLLIRSYTRQPFRDYNLLTCPTTVAHMEQIRKGSYIGSRSWRSLPSQSSQLHPCLRIDWTLSIPKILNSCMWDHDFPVGIAPAEDEQALPTRHYAPVEDALCFCFLLSKPCHDARLKDIRQKTKVICLSLFQDKQHEPSFKP